MLSTLFTVAIIYHVVSCYVELPFTPSGICNELDDVDYIIGVRSFLTNSRTNNYLVAVFVKYRPRQIKLGLTER